MATYPRYAIYYAPAPGSALDRFGASLLGYDAYHGENLSFPDGVPESKAVKLTASHLLRDAAKRTQ